MKKNLTTPTNLKGKRKHGFRKRDDGRYVPNYDLRLSVPFKSLKADEFDLWPMFEAISCPVLVVRGVEGPARAVAIVQD